MIGCINGFISVYLRLITVSLDKDLSRYLPYLEDGLPESYSYFVNGKGKPAIQYVCLASPILLCCYLPRSGHLRFMKRLMVMNSASEARTKVRAQIMYMVVRQRGVLDLGWPLAYIQLLAVV